MSPDEKRGYSKGYAAGLRRADRTLNAAARQRAENRFWQAVFCAALQGTIVSGRWQTGDKHWRRGADYVRGCGEIADEAVRQHGGART